MKFILMAFTLFMTVQLWAHNPLMVTHILSKENGLWFLNVTTATDGLRNAMKINSGKDLFLKGDVKKLKTPIFNYVESKIEIKDKKGEKIKLKRNDVMLNNHQVIVSFSLPERIKDVKGLNFSSIVGTENKNQINLVRILKNPHNKHFVLKSENKFHSVIN